jgi:hypothetical protein
MRSLTLDDFQYMLSLRDEGMTAGEIAKTLRIPAVEVHKVIGQLSDDVDETDSRWSREEAVAMDNKALVALIRHHPDLMPGELKISLARAVRGTMNDQRLSAA